MRKVESLGLLLNKKMNLNILVLKLLIINVIICIKSEEISSSLTYVDEIVILQKMFANLQNIKQSIDSWNTRYDEFLEHRRTFDKVSSIFDIRYDDLPLKCQNQSVPKNCAEATACTHRSGIYKILVKSYSNEPFLVECDAKTEGGDWMLIQRRQDGSVDFYRNWEEYKKGFGKIDGEFFIGLDKLHALTNYNGAQELLILFDDKNVAKHAKYSDFVVGNENDLYSLQHVGVYSGNAGDSLTYHLGNKFSTKDRDNDKYEKGNCAEIYTGAWWYQDCHYSNLNGKYGDTTHAKGINWYSWLKHNVSIQHVKMMIRRRTF